MGTLIRFPAPPPPPRTMHPGLLCLLCPELPSCDTLCDEFLETRRDFYQEHPGGRSPRKEE